MNEKKEQKHKLPFSPLKDGILLSICAVLILLPSLLFHYLKNDGTSYVSIKYKETYLIDIEADTKTTHFYFPKSGERRITISKDDSEKYFGYSDGFSFEGDSFTVTLYSDKKVEIKKDDIDCPDHVCSAYGKVSNSYTPIVCLPNQIQVMIESEKFPEYDA